MNLEKSQKLWFLLNRFDRTNPIDIERLRSDKEKYPYFYLLHWNEKYNTKNQRRIALKSNSRIQYFKSIHDIETIEKESPTDFNISLGTSNIVQNQLIEDFLSKLPTISKIKKNSTEYAMIEESDLSEVKYQSPVTESYAIILEKQGKYELAINIYEKLSLAKPEKRLYFASRISEIALKLSN